MRIGIIVCGCERVLMSIMQNNILLLLLTLHCTWVAVVAAALAAVAIAVEKLCAGKKPFNNALVLFIFHIVDK